MQPVQYTEDNRLRDPDEEGCRILTHLSNGIDSSRVNCFVETLRQFLTGNSNYGEQSLNALNSFNNGNALGCSWISLIRRCSQSHANQDVQEFCHILDKGMLWCKMSA
jgi:hypothetical protein